MAVPRLTRAASAIGEAIAGAAGEIGKVLRTNDPSLFKAGVSPLETPYLAVGDAKRVSDGAIETGTKLLTSTEAAFTSADVGKRVDVVGAGAAGVNLLTSISSVAGGVATLAVAASTTVTGKIVTYGTDDTEAIQKCLNAITKAGGGTMVLPPGYKFLVNWILPRSNVTVWGYGATMYFTSFNVAENKKMEQAGWILQALSTPEKVSLEPAGIAKPAVNFSLYGLTMPSDGVEIKTGIRVAVWFDVPGSDNIRIQDCKIDENKDGAINIMQATRVWIIDNIATNCCYASGRNAIDVAVELANPNGTHDVLIQGNHVENCPSEGITVGTKGGASMTVYQGRVRILGNSVVGENAQGIYCEGSFSGLGPGAAGVVIANNIVKLPGTSEKKVGITVTMGYEDTGPWENIIIANNLVEHGYEGIHAENVRGAVITGNIITEAIHFGIDASAQPIKVTGNTTEGSPTLTEVTIPGETKSQPVNGGYVTGAGISEGTYLVSGAGTATWTLSNNATATASGVALTTAAVSFDHNISGNIVRLPKNGGTGVRLSTITRATLSNNTIYFPPGSTEGETKIMHVEKCFNMTLNGNRGVNAPWFSMYLNQVHDLEVKHNTMRNGGQVAAKPCVQLKGAVNVSLEGNKFYDDQAESRMTNGIEGTGSFNFKNKAKNNEIFGATNASPITPLSAFTAISGNEMEQTKNNPAAPAAITVGESPFVYKNEDAYAQSVIVQGGTVSAIELSRNSGSTYFKTGATAGITVLRPGDWLKVTYSVKPTMDKVPI